MSWTLSCSQKVLVDGKKGHSRTKQKQLGARFVEYTYIYICIYVYI